MRVGRELGSPRDSLWSRSRRRHGEAEAADYYKLLRWSLRLQSGDTAIDAGVFGWSMVDDRSIVLLAYPNTEVNTEEKRKERAVRFGSGSTLSSVRATGHFRIIITLSVSLGSLNAVGCGVLSSCETTRIGPGSGPSRRPKSDPNVRRRRGIRLAI